MNQILDINRLIMYTKVKISLSKRMFLISLAGYLGLTFIISFFIAVNIQGGSAEVLNNFHLVAYIVLLFIGSVFISGKAYHDMNTTEKSITQLMIPASNFEKFISPLLLTSIGWIIISFTSYMLFALTSNMIWSVVFDLNSWYFNLFEYFKHPGSSYIIKSFFIIHAIFFLGSATFKKYAIGKTALAMFIVQNSMSFLWMFVMLILFGSFNSFDSNDIAISNKLAEYEWFSVESLGKLRMVGEAVVYLVLPTILYLTAYFKLKEREV